MSSTLEGLRQAHEDIEALKHLASCALQSRTSVPVTHPRLAAIPLPLATPRAAEHVASDAIHLAAQKTDTLKDVYASPDNGLRRANADLAAPDPLSLFYARLRELRDEHRTAAAVGTPFQAIPTEAERDGALLTVAQRPVAFSGEEGNGRYLDLMMHYSTFVNLQQGGHAGKGDDVVRVEYYEYVATAVTDFERIAPAVRNAHRYHAYLTRLLDYLVDFARRTHPLDRVEEHVAAARDRSKAAVVARLREMAGRFPDVQALAETMETEVVKAELMRLGLKCGGRPQDRVARLLRAAREESFGDRVVTEEVIGFMLLELLAEEREATVANVQKKLSLSFPEIEAERLADEAVADGATGTLRGEEAEDEVESTVYNPKDVPLGWDGKPIPYWMYKLHGLNHEFKCEICGNATFKGPRAFERHFTETQHVQGLRFLGIGYSKAYMMITRIADVNALHEKLSKANDEAAFNEDADMEFEDEEGNVLNKKTYTDLLRQGLL